MAKRKILMVDDDVDYVEAIRLVLESSGYEMVSASDGQGGLEKAESEHPDLIMLDVMMQETTEGFRVLNALQKAPATSKIPVMMLTAVGEQFPDSRLDTRQLPVAAFVEKPVKPGELLHRIEQLLKT